MSMNPSELINKHFGRVVTPWMHYHSPLPSELEAWYCYTEDGGHSIICGLTHCFEPGTDPGRWLAPVPVKTVLREHEIRNGFVFSDVRYEKEMGVIPPEGDYEYRYSHGEPASQFPMLLINNNGQDISGTNFWQTEWNARGLFVVSLNAGAFRLLVPEAANSEVSDMIRGCRHIIISRGLFEGRDSLEWMFEDDGRNPYSIHLEITACIPRPSSDWIGQPHVASVWSLRHGYPKKRIERSAHYRLVQTLPCLKPWNG